MPSLYHHSVMQNILQPFFSHIPKTKSNTFENKPKLIEELKKEKSTTL